MHNNCSLVVKLFKRVSEHYRLFFLFNRQMFHLYKSHFNSQVE
jgi:hypothetical protein